MAPSNFLLTPQQQELLFAALNANRPATTSAPLTMSPTSLDGALIPKTEDHGPSDFQAASFLDYDYSFDAADTSLDFSLNHADSSNLIDGLVDEADDALMDAANDDTKTESSTTGNDSPDKRGHPDDEDDDGAAANKRRESTEKIPKKPGRKPLTSEPSSKRKAQNRAAQRAFRERKEKHVKDLETKVAELEKASKAATSENGILRSQIEKMTVELNEYKKRFSLATAAQAANPLNRNLSFGNSIFNNINDVNFQFEFPKFGHLSGPSPAAAATTNGKNHASPAVTASPQRSWTVDSASTSNGTPNSAAAASSSHTSPQDTSRVPSKNATATKEDLSKLSNAFTPPLANTNTNNNNTNRSSLDSTATSSPSASSNYNAASNSSCATSPEPCNQSPTGSKPLDTLTTIGEEQSAATANPSNGTQDGSQFAHVSLDDMNWLNSQSSFRFDPQLFGDYRESQDNILSNGGFDDSFFNDALDVDFTTPFNMPPPPSTAPHKVDLIAQIDAAKDGEFASSSIAQCANRKDIRPTPVQISGPGQMLTCNVIWERLQSCPKVQNGDFDLDGLCSDLQKKAKCSGSGAVVDETDFKAVMSKYLGKGGEDCVTKLAKLDQTPL